MKIAQIAPLMESVPPRWYGGTERVVSYLTEELVNQGHAVTLFASGDSRTTARLTAICSEAIRLSPKIRDPIPYYSLMLEEIRRRADDFDIFHFHIDCLQYPLLRALQLPSVTTMHGRLDLPEYASLFAQFSEMPLVSISNAQRKPLAKAHWVGTVYHGFPDDLLQFCPEPQNYLAFLGRISVEKRPDRAIEIAQRAQVPVRIAAKVDSADRKYFDDHIRGLLDQPNVKFSGEIDEAGKSEFLGGAQALLFPIDWPEPFGLVMIEAMACGTPVIAWRCGSVTEIIEDGVTGFIVDNMDDAIAAVRRLHEIDRRQVRRRFLERFSAPQMAAGYVEVYQRLLKKNEPRLSIIR